MSAEAQLDQHFRQIPPFTGLKTFSNISFSKISQQTGNKQKAIMRQLITVLAPLLTLKAPFTMHFAKAVINFVLIVQYQTHNNKTLQYIEHALYRINSLKGVFWDF